MIARRCVVAIASVAALVIVAATAAVAASPLPTLEMCQDGANTQVIGSGSVEMRQVDPDTVAFVLTGPVAFVCAGPPFGVPDPDQTLSTPFTFLTVSYFGAAHEGEFGGAIIGRYPDLSMVLDLRAVALLMQGKLLGSGVIGTAHVDEERLVGASRNRGAGNRYKCRGCRLRLSLHSWERDWHPTLIALCPWPGEAIEVRLTVSPELDPDDPNR